MRAKYKTLMDKRGVLGLDTVRAVLITLLTLAVTCIAVFLALVSLQNAGIFTTSSASANNTNNIINNITGGATNFFTYVPTIFTILGVVVIILVVSIIIVAVSRFQTGSRGESL